MKKESMDLREHPWNVSTQEACDIQEKLRMLWEGHDRLDTHSSSDAICGPLRRGNQKKALTRRAMRKMNPGQKNFKARIADGAAYNLRDRV
jgi:hypothetical protein